MTNPHRHSSLFVARQLSAFGISVFPCCSSERAKAPLVPWKTSATDDFDIIEGWWRKWPDALLGMPAGKTNGVTILDIDLKNEVDGYASLVELGIDVEAYNGPVVRTPSGGLHIYFEYSPGLKNSASQIGPGLDVRNDGGYVIVAGEIKGVGFYGASF